MYWVLRALGFTPTQIMRGWLLSVVALGVVGGVLAMTAPDTTSTIQQQQLNTKQVGK